MGFVFAAFGAEGEGGGGGGVAEEEVEGAGGAGLLLLLLLLGGAAAAAAAAAAVARGRGEGEGEDVFVRVEGGEEGVGVRGEEVRGGGAEPVELGADFVREGFGQLGDGRGLEPEMDVAEAWGGGGELASAERGAEGADDAGEGGRVGGEGEGVGEGGDFAWLKGRVPGWGTAVEEAVCCGRECRGNL